MTSEGKPSYARHASRGGTNDQLRVPGLGKGTFRVLVRAADPRGTRVLHDATIKLDGDGETRLEVDAR